MITLLKVPSHGDDNGDVTLALVREPMTRSRGVDVLLVEDNPDHAEFTLKVHAPRPGLILLDMNIPKIAGPQVLQHVKSDETLRSIPIVMLTTSDHSGEVAASYRAGANGFVRKPVTFKLFADRIKTVNLYWTLTNHPPDV